MAENKKEKWLRAKAAQEGDGIISTGGWVGKWSGESEPVKGTAVAKRAKATTKNAPRQLKSPRNRVTVP